MAALSRPGSSRGTVKFHEHSVLPSPFPPARPPGLAGAICTLIAARPRAAPQNHCGLESGLLTLLSLKWLPGRASAGFHDYHHRNSNYARNAKNYGENFWLWDHAFGTLGKCRR